MTIHLSMENSDEPIVYTFSMGSEVVRDFITVDVTGKRRRFRITINDEKGIIQSFLCENKSTGDKTDV